MGVYWNMSRGCCSAQIQKVYDDANITLRFQHYKQSCRRIVTWHKYTFILIRYNRRAKRAGKFWNAHTKIPLIMPKILKCCSPICIFWKVYYSDTPSRSAPEPSKNPNFLDNILYTGTALYGQIVSTNNNHGYLGHNHLPDIVSLWGSIFNIILYVRWLHNGRIGSGSIPATRWAPYSNHCLSVR